MLSSILKTRLDEVYPKIYIALRITLNCPDTVANAVMNFSKLMLIETFNTPYMADSRLSSLAVLSVEDSCVRSVDLDVVIQAFSCQNLSPSRFDSAIM